MGKAGKVVGFVDWGDEEHECCALVGGGAVKTKRVVNDGEGLDKLCQWLRKLGDGDVLAVAVGIERPEGPVVDALLDWGFPTLAINPKQSKRFREARRLSGAKDDPSDALGGAVTLQRDPECFRQVVPASDEVIQLRGFTRRRAALVDRRVALTNQIRHQLLRYYPQFLELGPRDRSWFRELWRLLPSPKHAAKVSAGEIETVLRRFRVRKTTAKDILQLLRRKPLRTPAGVVRSAIAQLEQLFEELELVQRQCKKCEKQRNELMAHLAAKTQGAGDGPSDVEILQSLPGYGPTISGVVWAEISDAIEQRDLEVARTLGGAAPVTDKSGKAENRYRSRGHRRGKVLMRRACNPYLRHAYYHWGDKAIQKSDHYRANYARMRARGFTHARACRQVVDQLLPVAFAMLRDRTLYDPSLHGSTRRSGRETKATQSGAPAGGTHARRPQRPESTERRAGPGRRSRRAQRGAP